MRASPLFVIAALALPTALVFGDAAHADLLGTLGIGKETYESFKGKFYEQAPLRVEKPTKTTGTKTQSLADADLSVAADGWDGLPDAKLAAYAQGIENKLVAQWPGAPAIKVEISSNPGFEAYSTPQRKIRIARGVFDGTESEDEIAAVLGHESSHILLNHFVREEISKSRSRALTDVSAAATTAIILGHSQIRSPGGTPQLTLADQTSANKQVTNTLLTKFAIDEFSNAAMNAPWRREQEDEADLLGTDLMARAGYNVKAMTQALEREKAYEGERQSKIKNLSKQYGQQLGEQVKSGEFDLVEKGLLEVLGGVALGALDDIRDYLNRTHPDTATRIKDVGAYTAREYEDAPMPPLKKTAFEKMLSAPDVKPVLANHASAAKSRASAGADLQTAYQLALAATRAPTSDHPFPLRALAEAQKLRGNDTQALPTLERATASPYASYQTIVELAVYYESAHQYAKTEVALDRAADRFGSAEIVYPAKIRLYLLEGNQAKADATYKRCVAVLNNDLVQQCRDVSGKGCEGSSIVCAFKGGGQDVADRITNLFGK